METSMCIQAAEKIKAVYGLDYFNSLCKAEELLNICPEKLLPNISEWVKGEPLSDIYIGRYSVPMVMAIWKREDVLLAISVLAQLAKGDVDKAERLIWNMRR